MQRKDIDLLAGLLVIASVLALIFISLKAANTDSLGGGGETYLVDVSFENIGGIKEDSPVRSSGVLVGRVEDVRLDTDIYEAVVQVAINEQYRFPSDSSFSIVSTNLLGDQYIHVVAGANDENLQDGDSLIGNSALILEDLIGNFLVNKAEE